MPDTLERMVPNWQFDQATFARSAESFDNPDFVAVVIHNYCCMLGKEPGDPAFEQLERILAEKPKITVPTITLDGTSDPLKPGGTAKHAEMFTGMHEHRTINSGHNLPQEFPLAFANAVLEAQKWLD